MDIFLLTLRLVLATIFLVAGIAKLIDRESSLRTLGDFGTPRRLAPFLAFMLPFAELATAIALLPRATAKQAAFGALILLLSFSMVIGANLIAGRRPVCRCFGQLHARRVGWPTLARNAGLTALSGLLAWQGQEDAGASAVAWVEHLSWGERVGVSAGTVGLALLAIQGWALLHLLYRYGTLLERVDANQGAEHPLGLAIGTPAPAFELPDLSAELVSLEALLATGLPVAMVFVDLTCTHCVALLPEISQWQRDYLNDLTIVVIGSGGTQALRNASADYGLTHVLVQGSEELVDSYRIRGNPAAVVIHPNGTIDSPLALGTSAIRDLIAGRVTHRLPQRPRADDSRSSAHRARAALGDGSGVVN